MKRRDFFKRTAILGAALPFAPSLLANCPTTDAVPIPPLNLDNSYYRKWLANYGYGPAGSKLGSALIIDDPLAPSKTSPSEMTRIYESMNPPSHINCRCVSAPITS